MQTKNLYYMRKRNWIPLPQWGQFFLDLGYALGIQGDSENRIIAGLALPTRAYAAPLVASGVIAGRLSLPIRSNDALERFQQLNTLTIGTSLYYHTNGKRVRVVYDGLEETETGSMILLRAGSEIHKIPPTLALRIGIPPKEFSSLPPRWSNRQSDTSVSPFLSHFLDKKVAKTIVLQSHLDCMIIGSIGHIDQEVNRTRFAIQDSKGELLPGTLQDIIRVRKFSVNAETYRSDVYYTHRKEHQGSPQEIPDVVIFDGAKSYLRWNACWNYPHCVVLLAQTESDFDAAVQAFNEEFTKKHLKDVVFKKPLKFPKRVPISVYQEKRK